MAAPEEHDHPVDLVCEGGGVKGIGLAGAYSVLEEHGYRPNSVAGTSAGAITAALIAAGYSADELKKIVFEMDFGRFEDKDWEDHLPGVGVPLSLLLRTGIYKGEEFYQWLRGLLADKNVYTFADLKAHWERPKYDSRLQVIASDISSRRLLVLPRDAGVIGERWDTLEVAQAVRMSMSIPIFFEPVRMQNPQTNHEHVIVDGGMLSNFPVWLFDDEREAGCPTIGIRLDEEHESPEGGRVGRFFGRESGLGPTVEFVKGLAQTLVNAHDRHYLETSNFDRTISVPGLGVGTVDFDLSPATSRALYEAGRLAAGDFLDRWTDGRDPDSSACDPAKGLTAIAAD
jgi:NTE family protein